VGDECAIARMIHGLHPRYDVHQRRIVVMDMLHKFHLGVCRTSDENGACAFDRFDNPVQEILIFRRVPAAD
jgi:hypothetical protein